MRTSERNECWIDVGGVQEPQLLAHYARELATDVESLAACSLRVRRVATGSKGLLYSARLTLSRDRRRTSIDEINADAFLAVRDAFDVARAWLAERTVASDAWGAP